MSTRGLVTVQGGRASGGGGNPIGSIPVPTYSVVIPLEDPRGDPLKHLRTWTHEQTLPREDFQLVCASDCGEPELERDVEGILAPHDVLARAPGSSLFGLYVAAAAAAQADWLVFTEAHCMADPGCLVALTEARREQPDAVGFTMKIEQMSRTGSAELTMRWLEDVYAEWARQGWVRLTNAAFALRADAYARAGGLIPEHGVFSGSFLSARLADQGAHIGHARDALVRHQVENTVRETLVPSADWARGECIARAAHGHEFCERYFGHGGLWNDRAAYRPPVARALLRSLMAAAVRSPRSAPWLLREIVARVPAAVAGPRPRLLWERGVAGLAGAIADHVPMSFRRRWRLYGFAHRHTVAAGQLRWIREQQDRPSASPSPAPGLTAQALDGSRLVGAHGLESHDGRSFRWTQPVALLRLDPVARGGILRIDTGGVRGEPLGYLRSVHVGRRRLPLRECATDGAVVEVPLAATDGGDVTLVAKPLVPRREGSADRRRLGMPVFEVSVAGADAVEVRR